MVSLDVKIFLKFLYFEYLLLPKNFFKSVVFYEYLIISVLIYSVFFTDLTLRSKAIFTVVLIFALSILKVMALYKTGWHRAWYRKITGIPTKSEIRKMKQKKYEDKIIKQEEPSDSFNLPIK